MFYVYLLTHLPTQKFYIGRSTNPARRFGQHFGDSWDRSTKFALFMRDTHFADWSLDVIGEFSDLQESCDAELSEIRRRNAYESGLNSPPGTKDPEKHAARGRELSSWVRENGPWHAGRSGVYTDSALSKMSAAKQGNTNLARAFANPEWRANRLAQMKELGKSVICTTTGEIFQSVGDAALFAKTGRCDIRRVCNGKRKHVKSLEFKWYTES